MLKKGSEYTFRGYYILNPEGLVRGRVVGDLPVGLYAGEILRQVASLVAAEGLGVQDSAVLENPVETSNFSFHYLRSDKSFYEEQVLSKHSYPLSTTGEYCSTIFVLIITLIEPCFSNNQQT